MKNYLFFLISALILFLTACGETKETEVNNADSAGGEQEEEVAETEEVKDVDVKEEIEEVEESETEEAIEETSEEEIAEETVESPDETLSQKNAVDMAENYLSYTAFSKSGLIEQLKYEGFDDDDANYAVNQISVDWQEQAVLMAQNYLDYSNFSRSGLIEQLVYEGFSNEDATYAADEMGL
ncbi:Ltp family lipoprotein [Virgibacillus proomii]|jgi:colicin import membrane protein|uniref:Ltp family lipoprotein n=1 Tax=Virgibacillus proomii TaxID=84407 RepID=UPI0009858BC7|nr:Ltp family lipoprotein [Virgibacillus proomii]